MFSVLTYFRTLNLIYLDCGFENIILGMIAIVTVLGQFAYGHFAYGHFAYGQLAYRTVGLRTIRLTDYSPNGQYA